MLKGLIDKLSSHKSPSLSLFPRKPDLSVGMDSGPKKQTLKWDFGGGSSAGWVAMRTPSVVDSF